ncbi:glutathione S-transferase family protein [Verrucomicrobiota bacterium sgz303538]
MSVTVFQLAHSPFCIPITAALRSCGVQYAEQEVSNADRSEILRLTGGTYYQVPVLVHDDNVIFESGPATQDVARYVEKQFAGGRLFPERLEGLQAILIDFLEDQVEGVTFRLVDPYYLDAIDDVIERGMIIRHKERKFGRGCVEAWRQGAVALRAEADRLLDRFETTLRHTPFLFGDSPVYSDFLLFGILGNLTYSNWNQLEPDRQRALIEWQERMRAFRW